MKKTGSFEWCCSLMVLCVFLRLVRHNKSLSLQRKVMPLIVLWELYATPVETDFMRGENFCLCFLQIQYTLAAFLLLVMVCVWLSVGAHQYFVLRRIAFIEGRTSPGKIFPTHKNSFWSYLKKKCCKIEFLVNKVIDWLLFENEWQIHLYLDPFSAMSLWYICDGSWTRDIYMY